MNLQLPAILSLKTFNYFLIGLAFFYRKSSIGFANIQVFAEARSPKVRSKNTGCLLGSFLPSYIFFLFHPLLFFPIILLPSRSFTSEVFFGCCVFSRSSLLILLSSFPQLNSNACPCCLFHEFPNFKNRCGFVILFMHFAHPFFFH